jgi:ribosome-binding factor A
MKNRMARVVQLVHKELSEIIQKDLEFPGVIVGVNSVEVTPDLRHAHVYVGAVGRPGGAEEAMDKLNARRPHLQKRLAARVKLQFTPQLHFNLDDSVERGIRVTNIMEQIDRQMQENPAKAPGEDKQP